MVDCAMMGVDWRDLTWWQYQAMLATWNLRHDPEAGRGTPDYTRLKKAMDASRLH